MAFFLDPQAVLDEVFRRDADEGVFVQEQRLHLGLVRFLAAHLLQQARRSGLVDLVRAEALRAEDLPFEFRLGGPPVRQFQRPARHADAHGRTIGDVPHGRRGVLGQEPAELVNGMVVRLLERVCVVHVAAGAVQVHGHGQAAGLHLLRQGAGIAGGGGGRAALVRGVAGETHEAAEHAAGSASNGGDGDFRVNRPFSAEDGLRVGLDVRLDRPVAHDEPPVAREFPFERMAEADLGLGASGQGLPERRDHLAHHGLDVRLVAGQRFDSGHRRAGVVVSGADEDPLAGEAELRLNAPADVVHLRPADAQEVELHERGALAVRFEDGDAREERIADLLDLDVLQPADFSRADGRRDVRLGEACTQGNPSFRTGPPDRSGHRIWFAFSMTFRMPRAMSCATFGPLGARSGTVMPVCESLCFCAIGYRFTS